MSVMHDACQQYETLKVMGGVRGVDELSSLFNMGCPIYKIKYVWI